MSFCHTVSWAVMLEAAPHHLSIIRPSACSPRPALSTLTAFPSPPFTYTPQDPEVIILPLHPLCTGLGGQSNRVFVMSPQRMA